MAHILIADDEPGLREFLGDVLSGDGHDVTRAADGAEASTLVDKKRFDLVLTDLKMPRVDGMTLLRKLRAEQPEVEIIVLTAHGSVDSAVEAMKLGAFDYLQKPLGSPEQVSLLVSRALEHRGLVDEKVRAARARVETSGPRLTYGDPAMEPVARAIEKVARTNATVLLTGESGTGKEVAAHAVHELSQRSERPFMAVNCASLSETLLESELFGHEKGAFTGATAQHRGRLELADGGTFFLDEVGELKNELQAKLLRVIQERRFERVGGTRTLEVDVRWIAATNRDLQAQMQAGKFREDLYHRLAVFPIQMPPLRERRTDILPIAGSLLDKIARDLGRPGMTLSREAEQKVLAWSWPGNVRELANALERAAILADGARIEASHLWLEGGPSLAAAAGGVGSASGELKSLADLERDAIERTLAAVGGNRRRASELLGIGERTLYDKIKKYGLE